MSVRSSARRPPVRAPGLDRARCSAAYSPIAEHTRAHSRQIPPRTPHAGRTWSAASMATTVIRLPSAAFGHPRGPAGRLGSRLMACGKTGQERPSRPIVPKQHADPGRVGGRALVGLCWFVMVAVGGRCGIARSRSRVVPVPQQHSGRRSGRFIRRSAVPGVAGGVDGDGNRLSLLPPAGLRSGMASVPGSNTPRHDLGAEQDRD